MDFSSIGFVFIWAKAQFYISHIPDLKVGAICAGVGVEQNPFFQRKTSFIVIEKENKSRGLLIHSVLCEVS